MTGYNKIKHGIIILFYSFELWAQNEFGPKNAYFTMSNNVIGTLPSKMAAYRLSDWLYDIAVSLCQVVLLFKCLREAA